jgi:ABC-type glycerol-3-phosphate transport system permease component
MIPIKLGTVNILQIMVKLHFYDNIASLIIVYTAMGIPIGIFILTVFIREIPPQYGLVFAILAIASLPVIVFYLILSKQFVRGLSAGALKG